MWNYVYDSTVHDLAGAAAALRPRRAARSRGSSRRSCCGSPRRRRPGDGRAGAPRLRRLGRARLRDRAVGLSRAGNSPAPSRGGLRPARRAGRSARAAPRRPPTAPRGRRRCRASRSRLRSGGAVGRPRARGATSSAGRSARCASWSRRSRGTRSTPPLGGRRDRHHRHADRRAAGGARRRWSTELRGIPIEGIRLAFAEGQSASGPEGIRTGPGDICVAKVSKRFTLHDTGVAEGGMR